MLIASIFRNIFSRDILIKRCGLSCSYRFSQVQFASTAKIAKTDEPIKFSTSKAGEWKARYTVHGEDVDVVPEAQFYSVFISLSVFMLYFFWLREENDLDDYFRELETDTPAMLAKAIERNMKDANQNTQVLLYQKKLREMQELKYKLEKK